MNQEARIEKIEEIINRCSSKELLSQEIMWEGVLKTFKVYNIPLEYLVYNKYNGRILSRTKSLEKQNTLINVEDEKGRNLIAELLWKSKPDRNKKTQEDLKKFGQQKVGIITKDGVIIDGNRRAMLLNRIDKTAYFKAIVLPVTLEEEPVQIEKLETTYQMGEDEKLGYNSTEKYLKAKQIYDRLIDNYNDQDAKELISEWMNEPIGEIEKYLNTMKVMDEYLEYLEYDGIYTQLDGREDQFLSLTKWLNNFYGEASKKSFDGYSDGDVDDLKLISFDYLRFKKEFDGKEFRYLAEGNREKHFFGYENIWSSFSSNHFNIKKKLPKEVEIDFNSKNLHSHLDARDNEFYESSKLVSDESEFIENLNNHKDMLGYHKASNEPEKLIKKASQTFDAIKTNHSSFSNFEIQELVKELGDKVFNSLLDKSPCSILSHIVELLDSIDVSNVNETEIETIKKSCAKIQRSSYQLIKNLK